MAAYSILFITKTHCEMKTKIASIDQVDAMIVLGQNFKLGAKIQ